jgi:hypothetical protein
MGSGLGAVLTRRSQQKGDIVKVGRGIWGLKEWYPNRSFKTATKGNGDTATGDANESEQPLEPMLDVPEE